MDKDVINLIKNSASTFLNIAQMTQYRMRYLQERNAEDKEKMIKYTILSGVGIACLFMIGISGLIESRKWDERIVESGRLDVERLIFNISFYAFMPNNV